MTAHSHMSRAEKGLWKTSSAYRKVRRKLSTTALRIPHLWLRHRFLRPADVFFAAYPRSGTTWSRFTLFEILTGQDAGFEVVDRVVRRINSGPGPALLPGNGRLIGTHEQYRKEYRRAIYLVRDVRDVALSEYAYATALGSFRGNLDQFLEAFLDGKTNPFGPWQRHIKSWLDSPLAGTQNILLLRYEDLRENPLNGFTRMTEFLGIKLDRERILRAIANNCLDKMKEKERAQPRLASVKGQFISSGLVQGWRFRLIPPQLQFIEERAGRELQRLGYPRSGDVAGVDSSADRVFQMGELAGVTGEAKECIALREKEL